MLISALGSSPIFLPSSVAVVGMFTVICLPAVGIILRQAQILLPSKSLESLGPEPYRLF